MTTAPINVTTYDDLTREADHIESLARRSADALWQTVEDSLPNASAEQRETIVSLVENVLSRVLINEGAGCQVPDAAHIAFTSTLREHLAQGEDDQPSLLRECDDVHDAAADVIRAIDARLARRDLKLQDQIGLSAKFADMLGDAYVCDA